jgi:hypothetical protein
VLAVVGLVAHLLSWLLWPILGDFWGWGDVLKWLSGYEGITALDKSVRHGVMMILRVLPVYMLLAVAIVSSKKSS